MELDPFKLKLELPFYDSYHHRTSEEYLNLTTKIIQTVSQLYFKCLFDNYCGHPLRRNFCLGMFTLVDQKI